MKTYMLTVCFTRSRNGPHFSPNFPVRKADRALARVRRNGVKTKLFRRRSRIPPAGSINEFLYKFQATKEQSLFISTSVPSFYECPSGTFLLLIEMQAATTVSRDRRCWNTVRHQNNRSLRRLVKSRIPRQDLRINILLRLGCGIQKVGNTIAPSRLLHPQNSL